MKYTISLHNKKGLVFTFIDLQDAYNQLGYSFIFNYVGTNFLKVTRTPIIKGMIIVDYEYIIEQNQFILLDENGNFLTANDFYEIDLKNRINRIRKKRKVESFEFRKGSVSGIHKYKKRSFRLKHPKTQNERKQNHNEFHENHLGDIIKVSIRKSRLDLPTVWDEFCKSSYKNRNWKNFRKKQYK